MYFPHVVLEYETGFLCILDISLTDGSGWLFISLSAASTE